MVSHRMLSVRIFASAPQYVGKKDTIHLECCPRALVFLEKLVSVWFLSGLGILIILANKR